jgi:hypothetical protein
MLKRMCSCQWSLDILRCSQQGLGWANLDFSLVLEEDNDKDLEHEDDDFDEICPSRGTTKCLVNMSTRNIYEEHCTAY